MASKVFLFNGDSWLYCSDLTFKDGIYKGWVNNGAWKMAADTTKDIISYEIGVNNAKLLWACDPNGRFDYNDVIEDAKKRYKAGEPANFELVETFYKDDEDDVAF